MTGPTGVGKTLTIRAFLHEFNGMLTERTGRKDLGSRVIRAKVPELLSEWLGQSDKNIEELFNDIQAIAAEEIETIKGERLKLPVVVILEEAEGIARRRGEFDGSVYDRIIGTLLQRLDDPTDDLGKLPLILITTSNRPDLIDSAMWRRLAGMRARFTRLDREGTAAVLDKKLKPHYPFASSNGYSADQLRRRLISQVIAWLYSPNGEDRGLVEITLRDGKKITKCRHEFLTGAVIEQAVSSAIDQTVFRAEEAGLDGVGLSANCLCEALRNHIDGLADNLTAHNVADYVDLPDQAHVASIRRLRGSSGQLSDLVALDGNS
jgi:SpoVK/Ycf46/Vps4 family AAA+-type ATPase